jgi:hypothetical protein
MSDVSLIDESREMHKCVMSHTKDAYIDESRHTHKCVVSHA